MDQSVLVAIARFPDRGHAIEELARRNGDFRSLCADLADAEAAALRWEQSLLPVSGARSAEYRELARDLAAELEATLDRHSQRYLVTRTSLFSDCDGSSRRVHSRRK